MYGFKRGTERERQEKKIGRRRQTRKADKQTDRQETGQEPPRIINPYTTQNTHAPPNEPIPSHLLATPVPPPHHTSVHQNHHTRAPRYQASKKISVVSWRAQNTKNGNKKKRA